MRTLIVAIIMVAVSLTDAFPQAMGWSEHKYVDHCRNTDVMVDKDLGSWILGWNTSQKTVLAKLRADGYTVTVNDTALKFSPSEIMTIEINFRDDEVARVTTIYTLPLSYYKKFLELIVRKNNAEFEKKAKQIESDEMDYTLEWVDNSCNNPVASFLFAKEVAVRDKGFISMTTAVLR